LRSAVIVVGWLRIGASLLQSFSDDARDLIMLGATSRTAPTVVGSSVRRSRCARESRCARDASAPSCSEALCVRTSAERVVRMPR